MKKDFLAPVVKTLFIPEGNPGVQQVKEIRAVPRVIEADGDAQEITVTGEMDLRISYVPINDNDDEIPWRTIEFMEKNDSGQYENEEQVISRLESALKAEENEEEEENEEQWLKIDISVPFTLAIGTEGFSRDHIVKLDPCLHSSNWFLVGPKAIEFEAVLQLVPQAGEEEILNNKKEQTVMGAGGQIREEKQQEEVLITEHKTESITEQCQRAEKQIEAEAKPEPNSLVQQESGEKMELPKVQEAVKEQKLTTFQEQKEEEKGKNSNIKQQKQQKQEEAILKIKPKIQREIKPPTQPMIDPEIKKGEERHRMLAEKGYFQLKFYRVQLGEDLDAIADKFGISREKISNYNAINEEDIRTGLLLSIPRR